MSGWPSPFTELRLPHVYWSFPNMWPNACWSSENGWPMGTLSLMSRTELFLLILRPWLSFSILGNSIQTRILVAMLIIHSSQHNSLKLYFHSNPWLYILLFIHTDSGEEFNSHLDYCNDLPTAFPVTSLGFPNHTTHCCQAIFLKQKSDYATVLLKIMQWFLIYLQQTFAGRKLPEKHDHLEFIWRQKNSRYIKIDILE